MNDEKIQKFGYYLHYKNKVYRLVDFAVEDNTEQNKIVLYQPQYNTPGYGPDLLWSKPIELFFKNTVLNENTDNEKIVPRFKYIGFTEDQVKKYLQKENIVITPAPIFKKESMLNQGIRELVFGNFAIQGFAIDSDAEDNDPKRIRILYNKDGNNILKILPEKEFFELSNISPDNSAIMKYMKKIEKHNYNLN
jgi:hypothetical protein